MASPTDRAAPGGWPAAPRRALTPALLPGPAPVRPAASILD